MEQKAYNDASEKLIWDMACRRFRQRLPEKEAAAWLSGMELARLEDGTAWFRQSGRIAPGGDLENYFNQMEEALSWAAGSPLKLKMEENQPRQKVKKEPSGKRRWLGAAATLAAFCLLAVAGVGVTAAGNRSVEKSFYRMTTPKAEDSFRIVQLSDPGEDEGLLQQVESLGPDLILVSGHLSGRENTDFAAFYGGLAETAQTYYIFSEQDQEDAVLEEILEEAGVYVLDNECKTVSVGDTNIDLYGINPSVQSAEELCGGDSFREFCQERPENLKITISSEPYLYSDASGENLPDLLLAGHSAAQEKGLPVIGALYEENYGFLPEGKENAYMGGAYDVNGSLLIVSRGLSHRGWAQLYNRPDLVIVDVSRY